MSTIRHYRVLPRAMGPLNLLENIAEVPDQQVAKTGNRLSSDFFLLFSVSVTVRQASTITAEVITTKKSQKKYHCNNFSRYRARLAQDVGMV